MDFLAMDIEAGRFEVRDNNGHLHKYRKGGVYTAPPLGSFSPPSLNVSPDGRVLVVTENNVRKAPHSSS